MLLEWRYRKKILLLLLLLLLLGLHERLRNVGIDVRRTISGQNEQRHDGIREASDSREIRLRHVSAHVDGQRRD